MSTTLTAETPLPPMEDCPNGLRNKVESITDTEKLDALRVQKMARANFLYKAGSATLILTLVLFATWAVFNAFTLWPALFTLCVCFAAWAGASDEENESLHLQKRIGVLKLHFYLNRR